MPPRHNIGSPPKVTQEMRSTRLSQLRGHLIGMGVTGTSVEGKGFARTIDIPGYAPYMVINGVRDILIKGRPSWTALHLPRKQKRIPIVFDVPPHPQTDIEETFVMLRLDDFIRLHHQAHPTTKDR